MTTKQPLAARKTMRRVALAYPVSLPWMALFARGVSAYAQQRGGWIITTCPPPLTDADPATLNVHTLKGWPADGAILAINNPTEARAARRLGFPVVNLAGALREAALPRVMVDHRAIGRLAAEHLLQRGLRRLAYCGMKGLWFAEQRGQGFCERAREAGVACDVFELPPSKNPNTPWCNRMAPLDRWLEGLAAPVGLMAAHDHLAQVVVDECRRLGLSVPHDAAVIGCDNDTILCEFCRPTLSSVSRSAWRVGYEAAALLDGLMSGKKPPSHDILIPPDGVVARQSTDTVAVDDPHIAAVVRFLSDHVAEGCGVEQALRRAPISRRQLEIRFRRLLDCSPHEYLSRLRTEAAKGYLDRPEPVKLQRIASACGFSSEKHLRQVFRRVAGMTPMEYRSRNRAERTLGL